MRKNRTYHKKKTVIVFLGCMCMLLGLMGRMVYLMVIRSDYYAKKAEELHERERDIKAARGRILDRNGEVLADALNNQGITAAVIGHTTDNNDKILRNGEEMRYIDRPAPDEILKLYSGGMNDGRIKKADTPVSGEA